MRLYRLGRETTTLCNPERNEKEMTAVVVAAAKAAPKKATRETVATPNGLTSAALTMTDIAEKDKESAKKIDSRVTERMTSFSGSLAEIKPTGLTPAESQQEAEHRNKLSIAVEVFIRCDLQFKAAGRKRDHARFELGEQIAGFRPFYKGERVWGAVKSKLAEGLGVSGKTIDRIHCCPNWLRTRLSTVKNTGHDHPLLPWDKAGWPLENRFPLMDAV